LQIETTSLAVLAWTRALDGPHSVVVSESDSGDEQSLSAALRFLHANCRDGRFASTQATVLALKAIVQHSKAVRRRRVRHASTTEPVVVGLYLNDRLAASVEYTEESTTRPLCFDSSQVNRWLNSQSSQPGELSLRLVSGDGSQLPQDLPYSILVNFQVHTCGVCWRVCVVVVVVYPCVHSFFIPFSFTLIDRPTNHPSLIECPCGPTLIECPCGPPRLPDLFRLAAPLVTWT